MSSRFARGIVNKMALRLGVCGAIGFAGVHAFKAPLVQQWIQHNFVAFADSEVTTESADHPQFTDEDIEIYRQDYRTYMSATPQPDDMDHAVKVLSGENFKNVVMDESKDVFVEFFAPDCHACASFAVILRFIAEAASDIPSLVICKMDGVNNYVPGVLTMDEDGVYPTMKMFPGSHTKTEHMEQMSKLVTKVQQEIADIVAARARGESPDIVTARDTETGVGTAVAMVGGADYSWNMFIDFMHERAEHKFDKDLVKARVAARVTDLVAEILKVNSGHQEAFQQCVDAIPCGPEWESLYDVIRLKGVGAARREDIMEAVWATKSCISDKRNEIKHFWSSMDRFSQENRNILEDIEQEEASLREKGVDVEKARQANKDEKKQNEH